MSDDEEQDWPHWSLDCDCCYIGFGNTLKEPSMTSLCACEKCSKEILYLNTFFTDITAMEAHLKSVNISDPTAGNIIVKIERLRDDCELMPIKCKQCSKIIGLWIIDRDRDKDEDAECYCFCSTFDYD